MPSKSRKYYTASENQVKRENLQILKANFKKISLSVEVVPHVKRKMAEKKAMWGSQLVNQEKLISKIICINSMTKYCNLKYLHRV